MKYRGMPLGVILLGLLPVSAHAQQYRSSGSSVYQPASAAPVYVSSPTRSAPVQQYTAPVQQYTAPVRPYVAPVQQYAAPVQTYTAPVSRNAAPSTYIAPATQYKAPASAPEVKYEDLGGSRWRMREVPRAATATTMTPASSPKEPSLFDQTLANSRQNLANEKIRFDAGMARLKASQERIDANKKTAAYVAEGKTLPNQGVYTYKGGSYAVEGTPLPNQGTYTYKGGSYAVEGAPLPNQGTYTYKGGSYVAEGKGADENEAPAVESTPRPSAPPAYPRPAYSPPARVQSPEERAIIERTKSNGWSAWEKDVAERDRRNQKFEQEMAAQRARERAERMKRLGNIFDPAVKDSN